MIVDRTNNRGLSVLNAPRKGGKNDGADEWPTRGNAQIAVVPRVFRLEKQPGNTTILFIDPLEI